MMMLADRVRLDIMRQEEISAKAAADRQMEAARWQAEQRQGEQRQASRAASEGSVHDDRRGCNPITAAILGKEAKKHATWKGDINYSQIPDFEKVKESVRGIIIATPGTQINNDVEFEAYWLAGKPKRGGKQSKEALVLGGLHCFCKLLQGRVAKMDTDNVQTVFKQLNLGYCDINSINITDDKSLAMEAKCQEIGEENDGAGWRSSNKTLINRPLTEAALAARYDTGKVTSAMVDGQEKLVLLPDVVDTATGVTSLTKVSVTIEQLARFWYKVERKIKDPLNQETGSHQDGIIKNILKLRVVMERNPELLGPRLVVYDNQHAHYVTEALQQWIEGEVASADGGGGEEEEEFPDSE